MKIELKQGQPVIDARDLGELLGLAPADVQTRIRSGEITSRFETGTGEDAGRFRLTFSFKDQRVRLTCTLDGEVVSTSRFSYGRL